jgi:hypothetical protein
MLRPSVLLLTFASITLAGSTHASFITVGSSGHRSASATFVQSGTDLIITLKNTATQKALIPDDVLTAMFFKMDVNVNFGRTSALLGPGSTVLNASQPAGGVVGGEWAMESNISLPIFSTASGTQYGISSAGHGDLFGPGVVFPGPNLDGPAAPNGMNYGIVSDIDYANANSPIQTNPFIKDSVVFTISGLPVGYTFHANSIREFFFQYGTSLDQPRFGGNTPLTPQGPPITPLNGVPAPAGLVLAIAGLGTFGLARLRRRSA